MRQGPLVSAIRIFLNAERFIEEAIETVLAQTYTSWELLLVDDGSSDGGTEIARRYAERHPGRVRYFDHPGHVNRGMSASRNLGIRHARGAYVAFLDADDVWLPHKLEQQVALLEAHPEAGMLMGASLYWYGWTGRAEDAALDRLVPVGAAQDALIGPPALLTTLYPLGTGAAPCVASLLIRRPLLDAVGGFEGSFRDALQLYEDQAFLTKAYRATPVYVTSRCTDWYRQHPDLCVSKVTGEGRYHTVRQRFLTWFESYLAAQGEDRDEVWQALNAALARYRHPVRSFLVRLCRGVVGAAAGSLRRLMPRPLWSWLGHFRSAPWAGYSPVATETRAKSGSSSMDVEHR